MLTEHQHKPGRFDPSHCRPCARKAGLLDHYHRVQGRQEAFAEVRDRARQARTYTIRALWASAVGVVLAAIALFTG